MNSLLGISLVWKNSLIIFHIQTSMTRTLFLGVHRKQENGFQSFFRPPLSSPQTRKWLQYTSYYSLATKACRTTRMVGWLPCQAMHQISFWTCPLLCFRVGIPLTTRLDLIWEFQWNVCSLPKLIHSTKRLLPVLSAFPTLYSLLPSSTRWALHNASLSPPFLPFQLFFHPTEGKSGVEETVTDA